MDAKNSSSLNKGRILDKKKVTGFNGGEMQQDFKNVVML